jgi:type IV pilus assembly protein PilC
MPQYTVEALTADNKRIRAQVQASSPNEALQKMQSRGYKPLKVSAADGAAQTGAPAATGAATATPPAGGPPMPAPAAAGPKVRKGLSFGGRVSHKQLTQFTSQLSVLVNAGLPIVRSLKILANQMKPCALKNMVADVAEDVETGSSLSEALAKHPRAFDKLYVNMVRAGEAGGVLDVILERLAQYMEKIQALRRKIISASIYPAVVITIAVIVVLSIMTFIVPKFKEVFEQVNVNLPAPTQFLMSVSNFIKSFWWLILASPILLFVIYKIWSRTSAGRYMLDKVKLNFPLMGVIVRKAVTARFTRTLGTLLKSGVPILDALSIVKGTVGNEIVAAAIGKVYDSVKEGESVAGPLGEAGIFDDIVVNMIDVGEETGELDKMLEKIADTYDAEVDAAVSGLVSILEPMLIVFLGCTVGFIVISLFMPLLSLLQNLGK